MKSKNSLIAISGYKAKDIFISSHDIKVSLEKYFKLNITNIIKIHGKNMIQILYLIITQRLIYKIKK